MPRQVNLSTTFAQQVIAAAHTGCQHLAPGITWEASKLCGPTFWNGLAKPEQLHAGQIIAAAINHGLLPLINRGRSGSNHQMYELDTNPCGGFAESTPPWCVGNNPSTTNSNME
ncbi:MAG: hypothetical protein V7722_04395 [Porticoccus sp.]